MSPPKWHYSTPEELGEIVIEKFKPKPKRRKRYHRYIVKIERKVAK